MKTWVHAQHPDGSWIVYDEAGEGRTVSGLFDGRDARALAAHRNGGHRRRPLARCEDCMAALDGHPHTS